MGAPKVLVLHGYTQSATIFSKRMGALRKTVGKDIDFVFVDAPHILLPADLAATFGASSDPDALGAADASTEASDPSLRPRAWWKVDALRTQSLGIEDSILLLRDLLVKERFAGVFGFSQGAALAAVLAGLLERPDAYPPFLVDGAPPHPPFTFAVCVAGFRAPGDIADKAFGADGEGQAKGYATPTLHVLGRNDVIVVEQRAKTLLDVSSGKRVVWHDGGHFVPSKGTWRQFFKAHLNDPLGDVPAPGASPSGDADSVPASGTATPAEASAPTRPADPSGPSRL